MNVKNWKRKHDEKLKKKYEIKISTYCFVCDETLTTFKSLENHIRDIKHQDNVEDLTKAIPEELRPKYLPKISEDDSFY